MPFANTDKRALELLSKRPIRNTGWELAAFNPDAQKWRRPGNAPGFVFTDHALIWNRRDEQYQRLYQQGVRIVFTPHTRKDVDSIAGVKILPAPYDAINPVEPARVKDVFYTFVGWVGANDRRRELATVQHPPDACVVLHDTWWGHLRGEKSAARAEDYKNALAHARFALVTEGDCPGSPRFWETLSAGAVPVLLHDLALPMPWPWGDTVLRFRGPLSELELFLRSIPPEDEQLRRELALEAYAAFQGDNLVSTVRWFFDGEQPTPQPSRLSPRR